MLCVLAVVQVMILMPIFLQERRKSFRGSSSLCNPVTSKSSSPSSSARGSSSGEELGAMIWSNGYPILLEMLDLQSGQLSLPWSQMSIQSKWNECLQLGRTLSCWRMRAQWIFVSLTSIKIQSTRWVDLLPVEAAFDDENVEAHK